MNFFEKLSVWGAEQTGLTGWKAYRSEAVHNGFLIDGAVVPMKTKGTRKGEPNFRKPVEGTYRRLFMSMDEMRGL